MTDYSQIPGLQQPDQKQGQSLAPGHTQAETQQAKTIYQQSRFKKQQNIKDFSEDPKRNKFKGSKLTTLVTQLNADNQELKQAMQQLLNVYEPRGFSAKQLGVSYDQKQQYQRDGTAALNDAVYEKTKHQLMPTGQNLELVKNWLAGQGIKVDGLSHQHLKQLIMLDDWPELLAEYVLPKIVEYGLPYLKQAYHKYVPKNIQSKVQAFFGSDGGLNPIDYGGSQVGLYPGQMFKQQMIPGYNVDQSKNQGMLDTKVGEDDKDAVSADFIKTLYATEWVKKGKPGTNQQKTSKIGYRMAIPIYVDTSGSTINCIFPQNQWSDGSTANGYFGIYGSAWNASSGGVTGWASSQAGMYSSTTAKGTFTRARLNATRVTCVFSNALTVNSSVQVGFFQKPPDSSNNTLPLGTAITNAYFNTTAEDIMGATWCQSGNLNSVYSGCYLPSDPDDETFDPQSTSTISVDYDEYFVVAIQGYLPSAVTQVGTMYLDYAIEADLTSYGKSFSYPDFCTQGGKTNALISVLTKQCPGLLTMSTSEAQKFVATLPEAVYSYDEAKARVKAFCSSVTIKSSASSCMGGNCPPESMSELILS